MVKKYNWIILCLVSLGELLQGQDLHFSQFYNAPQLLNPALTAVYPQDFRFIANVRSQWSAVPVPYATISVGYDQKLLNDGRLGNHILGGGLSLSYDKAGDSELQLLQIAGSVAYTRQISRLHFLSAGVRLGVAQRRFDASQLTFDEQFIDGTFTPNAATGENFSRFAYGFFDLSAGINWLFQISKRMKFNLGIAATHLNHPRSGFLDATHRFSSRWNLQLEAVVQLHPKLDLMPAAVYSLQNSQQERVFGTALKYHLDERFAREKGLIAGFWYRMNDAAITSFGVEYPTWKATVSYDLNTSDFSNATGGAGGVEFSFVYTVTTVKPPEQIKTCPIF